MCVQLPKRRVDYRIEPKIVASTKGQGAAAGAGGISVSVIVSGPWHNISYKPDLAGAIGGLAKDPTKALKSLKGLIPGKSGADGSKPKLRVPDAKISTERAVWPIIRAEQEIMAKKTGCLTIETA